MREADERTSHFAGRERELAEVHSAIDDALAGRGRILLFAGEPGIGKTRLADEAAIRAASSGMRATWGRCWEGSGAPAHWPWIQVIRELIAESNAPAVRSRTLPAEIARMLPELSSEAPEPEAQIDAEQARFRLFDAVATLLKERAREHPVLIVLDDLHEADAASLQLLKFIARVLHDAHVLLIGTYRDAEMRRSAERSRLMDAITRDALVLPITGLTEGEVGDLVAGRAEGTPAAGFVVHLHRATAGNPLFVDGVLRALAAEGRLGGGARLDLRGFKLPDSVRSAIRRRLDWLSADARAVLTTAAVIGLEFEQELISLLHGHAADISALLVEAAEMGIVGFAGPSSCRFAHPLLREGLYGELPAGERNLVHRKVAAALERLHRANPTPHLADLARHWRAAAQSPEEIEKAIDYSMRAGDAAEAVLAYEDATGHFRAAMELDAEQGDNLVRRAVLLERLGVVTGLIDRDESIRYTEEALGIYEQVGLAERAAGCHIRLGNALSPIGQPRTRLGSQKARWNCDVLRARDHFRRAEGLLSQGGETPILARLYYGIALNAAMSLRTTEGLNASRRAMEIAELLHRRDLWAAATNVHAKNLAWRGELASGWASLEKAWETADREEAGGAAFGATWIASTICFGLRDAKEGVRWCQRELDKPRTAQSPLRRGLILQLMGNDTAALGELTEAHRLSPETDWGLLQGRRLFLEGKWEEAEGLLKSEIVESRRVGDLLSLSLCARYLGSVLRVRGAVRQAVLVLAETVKETIADIGEPNVMTEMQMRSELSRANAERGHYDAAGRELARCREILAKGEDWRGLSGDVARAAAVVAAAQGRYQEAHGEFEKAFSIFRRYTAPWEEADTLECWASALLAAGDRAGAVEKFDAAIQTYRRIAASERWSERVTAARERAVVVTGCAEAASASGTGRHPASATLCCNGNYWIVSDGRTTVHLKDMKGLHYIRQLLCHPGDELHVLDLVGRERAAADLRPDRNPEANVGLPVLDAEARSAYRRRVRELREELAEADECNDSGRAERARGEIDAITAQLSAAVGLGGRGRVTGSSVERARSTVTHGIKAALRNIRHSLPAFGAELALRLKTGTFCIYMPDPSHPTDWTL